MSEPLCRMKTGYHQQYPCHRAAKANGFCGHHQWAAQPLRSCRMADGEMVCLPECPGCNQPCCKPELYPHLKRP